MCRPISGVLARPINDQWNNVVLSLSDDHSAAILPSMFIVDGRPIDHFMRYEFAPTGGAWADVDGYRLRIDETSRPPWFDDEAEARLVAELRRYVESHTITGDVRALMPGRYIVAGKCKVAALAGPVLMHVDEAAELTLPEIRYGIHVELGDVWGSVTTGDVWGSVTTGDILDGGSVTTGIVECGSVMTGVVMSGGSVTTGTVLGGSVATGTVECGGSVATGDVWNGGNVTTGGVNGSVTTGGVCGSGNVTTGDVRGSGSVKHGELVHATSTMKVGNRLLTGPLKAGIITADLVTPMAATNQGR